MIRRSSEHLADLIESLLDISRIEANRLEIQRGETRFRELLDQMADIFRLAAQDKGLRFVYDPGDAPERVLADERRRRQTLLNVLSNAVKYTTLAVALHRVLPQRRRQLHGGGYLPRRAERQA